MCNSAVYFTAHGFYDVLPTVFSATSIPPVEAPPKSLKTALNMYDSEEWMKACSKEIKSLADKKFWSLVDRPRDKKVIRGMWLFKRKTQSDGSIKHKSPYVAMGNTPESTTAKPLLQQENLPLYVSLSPWPPSTVGKCIRWMPSLLS